MPKGRGRILVIDDEEVIRDACMHVLSKEGHIVATAENGEQGLRLFREFHPDLVLIDLKMRGKSGLEVLEEIGTLDPKTVGIMITGYATISSAVESMRKGAFDFVPKPFTPDEIRLIVAHGLERRRLILENEALKMEQEKIRRNMISLVSHELRAPLAAAVQYLDVILGGMAGEVSQDARDLMDRSNVRLREMLGLISRWLNLATFDPIKMAERFEDVQLSRVAAESIKILKPLAEERRIEVILETPKDLPLMRGCEAALGEVLNNLLSNAIKYNRPGGWVKIGLLEKDQEVIVEVSDNGMGIGEEHLDRIFDEFYRVDGRRNAPIKGSGLGLSIVKKLVETHNGIIDVESRLGEGTTFRIRFPKIVPYTKEALGWTLLVDDEKEFLEPLWERMKIRKMKSEIALNGKEALKILRDREPDVMILDLRMPGMDGMDVLRLVKEKHPDIQVIILTGHGTEEDEKKARDLGVAAYLQKPADVNELTRAIEEAWERRRRKQERTNRQGSEK